MKKIIASSLMLVSAVSNAGTIDEDGAVNKLRVVSSAHQSASEYTAVFTLNPAQSTCTWVKVAPGSEAYISTLLFAKAQNMNVTVWYDDVSCQTITIEVK